MSESEFNKKILSDPLKGQIHNYFSKISLNHKKKQQLEYTLLHYSASKKLYKNIMRLKSKCMFFLTENKKLLFSHVLVAASTAFFTFSFYENRSNQHDLTSVIALLPEPNSMPPDFDLVGDAAALPSLSIETLSSESFRPIIPKQISQRYTAFEGRFFQMNGEQGVSIVMEPILQPHVVPKVHIKSSPETLYIVKLSENNKFSFPSKKILQKIQSSPGKIKRIYAWRDEAYGYAMVQQQSNSIGVNVNEKNQSVIEDEVN